MPYAVHSSIFHEMMSFRAMLPLPLDDDAALLVVMARRLLPRLRYLISYCHAIFLADYFFFDATPFFRDICRPALMLPIQIFLMLLFLFR